MYNITSLTSYLGCICIFIFGLTYITADDISEIFSM